VNILRSHFNRETDFVARIGGEEFVIVMAETNIHDASKRAETALLKIRKEALLINEHTLRFTVSMGVAQQLSGEAPSDWLKRADKALYESKQNGRDRYTIAGLSAVKEAV
jgi:diguanylate cyclase (GGDEF)-like protein